MAQTFLHPINAWRHYRAIKRHLAEIGARTISRRPHAWQLAAPARR